MTLLLIHRMVKNLRKIWIQERHRWAILDSEGVREVSMAPLFWISNLGIPSPFIFNLIVHLQFDQVTPKIQVLGLFSFLLYLFFLYQIMIYLFILFLFLKCWFTVPMFFTHVDQSYFIYFYFYVFSPLYFSWYLFKKIRQSFLKKLMSLIMKNMYLYIIGYERDVFYVI